jgi:hypothetical protein
MLCMSWARDRSIMTESPALAAGEEINEGALFQDFTRRVPCSVFALTTFTSCMCVAGDHLAGDLSLRIAKAIKNDAKRQPPRVSPLTT